MLKSIINIGAEFEDPEKSSTIAVQNSFAASSTILAIPFEIYFALNDRWDIVCVFFFTQVVLMLSFILNAKGHIRISKTIIVGIFATVLPIYSAIIGFNSGFYIYYLLGPALIGTLFDYSEKKFFFTSISVALVSLGLCLYFGRIHPNSIAGVSEQTSLLFLRVNFAVCFIILSYVTFHMVRHHYETNGRLKKSNKQLQKLINEKEILLAEVHHRVKNNMAIMNSLINLQIHQTTNKDAQELLLRNAERLQSMSMTHNYLYNQKDFEQIDFKKYLVDLTKDLIASYQNDDLVISSRFNLQPIIIPLNKAVPLGLITNEIIVNSFKHAFKGKTQGEIFIGINRLNDKIELTVSDDGNGFEKSENYGTLGTTLINDLVDQVDGELTVDSDINNGTTYKILIEVDEYN